MDAIWDIFKKKTEDRLTRVQVIRFVNGSSYSCSFRVPQLFLHLFVWARAVQWNIELFVSYGRGILDFDISNGCLWFLSFSREVLWIVGNASQCWQCISVQICTIEWIICLKIFETREVSFEIQNTLESLLHGGGIIIEKFPFRCSSIEKFRLPRVPRYRIE